MILASLFTSIFLLRQGDFSTEIRLNGGKFGGANFYSTGTYSEEKNFSDVLVGSQDIESTQAYGRSANGGPKLYSYDRRTICVQDGKLLWAKIFSPDLAAISDKYFVSGGRDWVPNSRLMHQTATLYRISDCQCLWRWYFYEFRGRWPKEGTMGRIDPDGTFNISTFRIKPGYAPSLGEAGRISADLIDKYTRTWARQYGNPKEAELIRDAYVWKDQLFYPTGRIAWPGGVKFEVALKYDQGFLKEQILYKAFREFAYKFMLAKQRIVELGDLPDSGQVSTEEIRRSYPAVKVFDEMNLLSEQEEQKLIDTQGTREEIAEMLQLRYTAAINTLVARMQAIIDGPLLPKSGTVSTEFNPNTARLVKMAMQADSLTEVQKRRVNACWLFDLMKTDLGCFVPYD